MTSYAPDLMDHAHAFTTDSVAVGLHRGAQLAGRWQAHALADLAWADRDRLSDQLRASARGLWTATVCQLIESLCEPLHRPIHVGGVLDILQTAQWVTPERLRPALIESQHRWLGARLRAAARPFGITDPLEELSAGSGRTALLARDLLGARAVEGVILSAGAWDDLCWAAAAALRTALARVNEPTAAEDEILRFTVQQRLANHDEDAAPGSLARRLARRLPSDRLMPGAALLCGHTHLAIALLAERVPVPVDRLSDWLFGPDPVPFAVALRAGGEDAAGVGGLLATLGTARQQPLEPLIAQAALLRSEDECSAAHLLREFTR